jgi:mannose-6-phosphate isomerase-like protein (cupin superfamily)
MKQKLVDYPIHLGLGAKASVEPFFFGTEWYSTYEARHSDDGNEGRLVSIYTFDKPWDSWEMHPYGSEVVFCIQGGITLIQKVEGKHQHILLQTGEYIINPPGIWHTADVSNSATVLFITAGKGTEQKKR